MTTPDPFTVTETIASLVDAASLYAYCAGVLVGTVWAVWGNARGRGRG